MEFTIADLTKATAVSMRLWRYVCLLMERLRSNRHDLRVRPYPVRPGNSLWIGVGVIGWLLTRLLRKRRRTYVTSIEKAEGHPSQRINSLPATKHPKSGRGILSLAIELLGAVAISLAQRYARSWRSALMVQIKDSPYRSEFSTSATETDPNALPELPDRFETK